jgi:hypothetical protein
VFRLQKLPMPLTVAAHYSYVVNPQFVPSPVPPPLYSRKDKDAVSQGAETSYPAQDVYLAKQLGRLSSHSRLFCSEEVDQPIHR